MYPPSPHSGPQLQIKIIIESLIDRKLLYVQLNMETSYIIPGKGLHMLCLKSVTFVREGFYRATPTNLSPDHAALQQFCSPLSIGW